MHIFLSYASTSRSTAEDLCHRLQADGHEVFFDREDLPAGQSYDSHIRAAIDRSALFIFLVTPDSVSSGRYTLTELKLAARRWPTPGLHVLPVMAAPTPFEAIPSYLRALNLLQPEGNLAAEVLIEVSDRRAALKRLSSDADGMTARAPPAPDSRTPSYRTLTLRFEQHGDTVCLCWPGREPDVLALDVAALEKRLWAGATDLGDNARKASPLPAWVPAADAARAVGQALHQALFESTAGAGLTEQLRSVNAQTSEGLRVVVDTTAAPRLAKLPWEFLYDAAQEDFVFSDRMKPLVRRLDVDAAPPRLAITAPLRLLIAVAAPAGRPDLLVGTELAQLHRALDSLTDSGGLQITRLDHTTLEALDEALLRDRPHVLHFIGHGDFVGDEGHLLLEDINGGAVPIAGRQLAVLLRNHLASLRLAFLNNCMGAATSTQDAFGGVAQSLLRRGLPAVVAMQFPIADADALTLSRHFYRYLAAGHPVDAALTAARAFMVARGDAVAWGAATLYMNAEDGRLFDVLPAPAGVAVTSAAAAAAVLEAAPPIATSPVDLPPPAHTYTHTDAPDANRKPLWVAIALGSFVLVGTLAWLALGGQSAVDALDMPVTITAPSPPPAPVLVPEQPAPAAADALLAQADQALTRGRYREARGLLDQLQANDQLTPEQQARAASLVGRAKRLSSGGGGGGTAAGQGLPTEERVYRVRSGDSLSGLAARFSGNANRWPELWQAHQRLAQRGAVEPIADPNQLRVGQPVVLPSLARSGQLVLRYSVQPGDTLSSIALRVYGNAQAWPRIQQANNLADPDLLLPGQTLLLN